MLRIPAGTCTSLTILILTIALGSQVFGPITVVKATNLFAAGMQVELQRLRPALAVFVSHI